MKYHGNKKQRVYQPTSNSNRVKSTCEGRLAASRDSIIIDEGTVSVEPESTAGECLEEVTFVGTVVEIFIGLDPCITSFDNWKNNDSLV